jgi:glycerate 2-kinase
MNVLIVPDKFKGTLTAHAAATLIAAGWHEVRPHDHLELLPMSDGGDGFGQVLASLLDVRVQRVETMDAAHRPLNAIWWLDRANNIAIVESAQIIGLALLPPKQFHPFDLDTFGLGAVMEAAQSHDVKQVLIGIGGSATNDGGFGLARSAGWKFLDQAHREIGQWTGLRSLRTVAEPPTKSWRGEVVVAVDVQNALLGPTGASHVYGPQKGLRPQDMALAEACLAQLAEVVERDLCLPGTSTESGTGAAGGLGFGLRCFMKARLQSGFELFSRHARLEDRIQASDVVITGEGAIDASTLMGKGVGQVASLCRRHGVPCIGLAGSLALPSETTRDASLFGCTYGIAPQLTTPEEARSNADVWVRRIAAVAAAHHDGQGHQRPMEPG